MAKYDYWITDDGLVELEGMARDGLTDEQIASNISIAPSTLYEWKKKYSEISESLKRGKEVIDRQVENALLKRALGYTVEEREYIEESLSDVEIAELRDKRKKELKEQHEDWTLEQINVELDKLPTIKKKVDRIKERHVVGDTTAQIFWLRNRKPKDWQNRTEVNITQTKSEAVIEMQEYLKKSDTT